MLIDAGPAVTYPLLRERIEALAAGERRFDVLVVTHIDDDHIGGVLKLLDDREDLGLEIGDVWFNGWKHLCDLLSPPQGEALTAQIEALQGTTWNGAFGDGTIVVPESGELPVVEVAGLQVTLLSPTPQKLEALRPVWKRAVEEAGLLGSPAAEPAEVPDEGDALLGSLNVARLASEAFHEDGAEPNGSSIAFLVEKDGASALLTGDAHPGVLGSSIDRLLASRGKATLAVDLVKLPHHGSKHNVSRELLERLASPRYLVSTNGKQFKHPDAQAIARVVLHALGPKQLVFNYTTDLTSRWDDGDLRRDHDYEAEYPDSADGGITVRLGGG